MSIKLMEIDNYQIYMAEVGDKKGNNAYFKIYISFDILFRANMYVHCGTCNY